MKGEIRSFGQGAAPHRRNSRAGAFTTVHIVGITGDGYVPVAEDYGALTARSVVGLPSLELPIASRDDLDGVRRRVLAGLRREFGYEADDIVPMESRSTPAFLLAPLLRAAGWRARVGFVPGVYEVPLRCVGEWLRLRRQAGALESPQLRRGLLLAQEFFPRWAQHRLRRALTQLKGQADHALVSA